MEVGVVTRRHSQTLVKRPPINRPGIKVAMRVFLFFSPLNGESFLGVHLSLHFPVISLKTYRIKDGEDRSIASDCTHKEKINFEGFMKMVAMATSHSVRRFYLIALTITITVLLQSKI